MRGYTFVPIILFCVQENYALRIPQAFATKSSATMFENKR